MRLEHCNDLKEKLHYKILFRHSLCRGLSSYDVTWNKSIISILLEFLSFGIFNTLVLTRSRTLFGFNILFLESKAVKISSEIVITNCPCSYSDESTFSCKESMLLLNFKWECLLTRLPHLKCVRLCSVRSSHLPFKMQ